VVSAGDANCKVAVWESRIFMILPTSASFYIGTSGWGIALDGEDGLRETFDGGRIVAASDGRRERN
jgi:hypothetical protein